MKGGTPTWVIMLYCSILFLFVAGLWVLLDYRTAISISAMIYLAFETGKLAARWYDERNTP
jgi:hypothetical protein